MYVNKDHPRFCTTWSTGNRFRAKVISAGKEEVVNCLQQGVQGRKAAVPCWVQSVCGSGVVQAGLCRVPALGW